MVFPFLSVSFGLMAFSVRFEMVKLVDFNEIEPKGSSDVEFIVSSLVVDADDNVDDVVVVEVVVPIVEFSLSVGVFFKSIILFISGKIFIVAKKFCKQTSTRNFKPFISEVSSSSHEQFFAVTTINKISFTIIFNISLCKLLAEILRGPGSEKKD